MPPAVHIKSQAGFDVYDQIICCDIVIAYIQYCILYYIVQFIWTLCSLNCLLCILYPNKFLTMFSFLLYLINVLYDLIYLKTMRPRVKTNLLTSTFFFNHVFNLFFPFFFKVTLWTNLPKDNVTHQCLIRLDQRNLFHWWTTVGCKM